MEHRNVLLVVHQEHSDPGRVRERLMALGYGCDVRRHACGDPLPATLDDHAGVVIFGGPMSANDDHHDYIRNEMRLIEKTMAADKPFLGICLGAQMLARTCGARVAPHPDGWHEIGYYRLHPTEQGRFLFEDGFHAYQWHGEGFEMPDCGTRLASSDYFANQAFQIGDKAYGVQFHPDVTPQMMDRWTAKARHRMVLPGAQARDRQLEYRQLYEPMMQTWCDRFLRLWLGRSNERPGDVALAAAAE